MSRWMQESEVTALLELLHQQELVESLSENAWIGNSPATSAIEATSRRPSWPSAPPGAGRAQAEMF